MKIKTITRVLEISIRWVARITAAIALLSWGAFFVAHLSEWFIKPLFTGTQLPPLKVWTAQLLHFGFLVGYIIGFKWELIGGLFVVFGVSAFFILIGILKFVPWTILPGVLYLFCWWLGRLRVNGEIKDA